MKEESSDGIVGNILDITGRVGSSEVCLCGNQKLAVQLLTAFFMRILSPPNLPKI